VTENSIQQARDVLAKRRGDTDAWKLDAYGEITDSAGELVARSVGPEDADLIVNTAGNPALWDAIDGLLETAMHGDYSPSFTLHAGRIAAAIIAADERIVS
jgi:hypothetical protein